MLRRTTQGLGMLAASQDFAVTRLMGIKANRVVAIAFALSGLLAGIAAIFILARRGTVEPTMGFNPVLKAFLATVIGGLGSLSGAVLGGFVLALVEVSLATFLPTDVARRSRRVLAADRHRDPVLPAGRAAGAQGGARVKRSLKEALARRRCCSAVPLATRRPRRDGGREPGQLRVVVSFLIPVSLVVALQTFSGNSGDRVLRAHRLHGRRRLRRRAAHHPAVLKETQLARPSGLARRCALGFVPSILAAPSSPRSSPLVVGGVLSRMREGAMAMATIGVLFIFFNLFDNWDA